jgi:hypothetical protein
MSLKKQQKRGSRTSKEESSSTEGPTIEVQVRSGQSKKDGWVAHGVQVVRGTSPITNQDLRRIANSSV